MACRTDVNSGPAWHPITWPAEAAPSLKAPVRDEQPDRGPACEGGRPRAARGASSRRTADLKHGLRHLRIGSSRPDLLVEAAYTVSSPRLPEGGSPRSCPSTTGAEDRLTAHGRSSIATPSSRRRREHWTSSIASRTGTGEVSAAGRGFRGGPARQLTRSGEGRGLLSAVLHRCLQLAHAPALSARRCRGPAMRPAATEHGGDVPSVRGTARWRCGSPRKVRAPLDEGTRPPSNRVPAA